MPKLLLIAYHFPPDAAVGAIRPAKFVKYLTRLGWKCYVVTVRENYVPARDPARLDDVNHLTILRTAVWPTLPQLALKLKRRLVRQTPTASVAVTADGTAKASPTHRRLKRYLKSLFELPDNQIGWLIPAVLAAYRVVRSEGVDVVITSSPPRTTALIGLLLSYVCRVKLVTDLRDPWFTPYREDSDFKSLFSQPLNSRSAAGDWIEAWLEEKLMERSARVITTTDRCALALRRAYRRLPEERVFNLPNGYDLEDLVAIGTVAPQRKFTISYLGTFYAYRTPRSFFEALGQLIKEGKLSVSDIEVNLIGQVRSTSDGSAGALIAFYGLTDCVRVAEPVCYKESLRQMMQSHVLLLFAPKQSYSIPAKTFEYLATRKPILCLAQEGATADLIDKTAAGVVVEPDDVGAIKIALLQLFEKFKAGNLTANTSDVSKYERQTLAEQLSRLLMEIAEGPLPRTSIARRRQLRPAKRPIQSPQKSGSADAPGGV